jgi:hypothetical protein
MASDDEREAPVAGAAPRDEIEKLKAELKRLRKFHLLSRRISEHEKYLAALHEFERSLPQPNAKGRPGKWKGLVGLEFLIAVREVQAARKCSKAKAISVVRRRREWRSLKNPDRELQARVADAEEYWSPWLKREAALDQWYDALTFEDDVAAIGAAEFVTKTTPK